MSKMVSKTKPTDEVTAIKRRLRKLERPADIKGIEVELGEDSTGDPAAWIWLLVDDDLNPSREKLREVAEFAAAVRSALLQEGLLHWPYVRLRAST